jgi:thioredoxin reductase (NADPH)
MAQVPVETDALIIGAGPVGLYQIFALGLQGIRCHVVDALSHTGGQCAELYPDKPIFDIPGTPKCTGLELIHNLEKQIAPFKAQFHLDQVVTGVARQADRRFLVTTSRSESFLARTVFIAAGVGAFLPRQLKVEGSADLPDQAIIYRTPDPALCSGKHMVIVGDSDTALQFAMSLAGSVASVTVMHRRDVLSASPATLQRFHSLQASGEVKLFVGQISAVHASEGRLQALSVITPSGLVERIPANQVVVLQGLSPKLGPVAQWGLALESKQLAVTAEDCSTNEPGIFAVGDINTYPGKRKLIICGFHEATLAAFGAAAIIFPEQPVVLQYTTTSSKLHKALGYSP